MKNILYLSIFTLICSSVAGQGFNTEIIGNKQVINLSREVSNFNHLRIIALDAELERGESNSVSLTAESNIIGHITSEVVGDTLVIQFDRNQPLRNIETPKIKLTFSNLNSILASASNIKLISPLENDSLLVKLQTKSSMEGMVKLNFLDLKMATSCNAELGGSANVALVTLFTKSILNAKNLLVNDLTLTGETFCKAELNVSDQLTAKLFVESTLINIGNAKPNVIYPSIDQMTSLKFFNQNLDLYKFN